MITAASLALLFLVPAHAPLAWSDDYDQPDISVIDVQPPAPPMFSPQELDELLAPIALYPDPLIAQILPAATFIDQIDEAARFVKLYGNSARIDDQPWDVSVKAVAHYPDLLYMMDQKYDWTVSLGQAFVNQQQEVLDAIQRLRVEARSAGTLVTTPQQQVVDSGGAIGIVPAMPDQIYIPSYDPSLVYVQQPYYYPAYGLVTFGTGFAIGVWLNRDCDWHHHRVFYHGWRGSGWIGRSRPHVHDRNHIYINSRHREITINHAVMRHDTQHFRRVIQSDVQRAREHGATGRPVRPHTPGQVAPPQRPPSAVPATPPPRPGVPVSPLSQPHDTKGAYRGQGKPPSAPSFNGYGGYGNRGDASVYRERGKNSRGSVPQPSGPPAAPARPVMPVRPVMPARPPVPARPVVMPSRPAPAVKVPAPVPAQRSAPPVTRQPSSFGSGGHGQPSKR
jgi:hypothetical protein